MQAIKLNFPMSAVAALPVLEFEARKDAAQVHHGSPCHSCTHVTSDFVQRQGNICCVPAMSLPGNTTMFTLWLRVDLVTKRLHTLRTLTMLARPLQLVGAIVRLDNSGDRPGERYVLENPQLLDMLFDGCAAAAAVHTNFQRLAHC